MLLGVSPWMRTRNANLRETSTSRRNSNTRFFVGDTLIGKGKLNEAEETAIAALASAVAAVPESALTFAEGHAANVRNMMHPAWTPIRAQAVLLLAFLDSRIAQNKAYFEQH